VSADTLFDQWHLKLASVLFRSSGIYHYQRNGEVLRETPSQEEVYTQVGLILEVLQAAREAAGVTEGSLNEQQKKVANDWLINKWIDKWCTNHDLRNRHQLEEAQANDETHQLLPHEPELTGYRRNQKRGAFHAFLKQFVGNTHLAYMMLNHGFTTWKEFCTLVENVKWSKTLTEHSTQLKIEEKTNRSRETLRERAQVARLKFKDGERISKQIKAGELLEEKLTGYQRSLNERFKGNYLFHEMIAANKAYGYGEGAQRPVFVTKHELEVEYITRKTHRALI
jgi:hypothetical protein